MPAPSEVLENAAAAGAAVEVRLVEPAPGSSYLPPARSMNVPVA